MRDARLREELAIDVWPTQALEVLEHDYPKLHVRLHPFLCKVTDGDPRPLECAQLEWVEPPRLLDYRFPDANQPLIHSLTRIVAADHLPATDE